MRGAETGMARIEGRTQVHTMLLAGIALNALCLSGIGLLVFLANDAQLRSITFWNLGSVGGATAVRYDGATPPKD